MSEPTRLQKKLEGALRYCYKKMEWQASVCRVEISEKYFGDLKKHPDFGVNETGRYRKWRENITYTYEEAVKDLYSFRSARAGLPANTVFIKTGPESNLFVLDLDLIKGSLDSAYEFLGQIGYKPMAEEFAVKTQSGGLQIYMKGNPDLWDLLGTRSHIFGKGSPVDCRGPGGIVFGPTSEVIKYSEDNATVSTYRIADDIDPAKPILHEVHPALINFFRTTKDTYEIHGKTNSKLCTKTLEALSDKQKAVIQEAVAKCDAARAGYRSEECFSLLRLMIKFNLDPSYAYLIVKDVSKFKERDRHWFDEMWNKALPTVEYKPAYKKSSGSIGASPLTANAQLAITARPHVSASTILSINYEDKPPIQLADPWLYNNGILVICGRPGAGKTITALDLCRAAINGGPCWCDTLIFQKPCKVLYFHGDLSASVFINNYLNRMGLPLNDENFKPIILSEVLSMLNKDLLSGNDNNSFIDFNILDPTNRRLYIDLVSTYKPDIVILDSLSSFSYVNENDKKEMTEVLVALKMISDKFRHLVIALHHPRKECNDGKRAKLPLTMDDIRGSSAIAAHCDMVFGISNIFDNETGEKIDGQGRVHILKAGARGLELQKFESYDYKISNGSNGLIDIEYLNDTNASGSLIDKIIETEPEPDPVAVRNNDIDFLSECFEYAKTAFYPTVVEFICKKKQVKVRMALKYLKRYVDNETLIEFKEGRRKFYELAKKDLGIFEQEDK